MVERAAPALKVLRENLGKLGVRDRVRVQAAGVGTFLRSGMGAFDLIFLDPPYGEAEEYAETLGLLGASAASVLAEAALVIAEHRRKDRLEEQYGRLLRTRLLVQGDAALSFYSLRS